MLKGVLFDWDGTVCDTLPVCIKAFRTAMVKFLGRTLADSEITRFFGVNDLGVIMKTLPDRPEDWQPALAEYNRLYKEMHYLSPKPYDGILELLDGLKARGIKVGLITGKAPESCRISLEYTGLKDAFDFVRTGTEHGLIKAEYMQEFSRLFSLDLSDIYYVGDTNTDVMEAQKAKVHSIAVGWSSIFDAAAVAKEKPEQTFAKVEELDKFFKSLQ